MSRTLISPRRRNGRCRPSLERFESRLVLTTTTGSTAVAALIAPFDTSVAIPSGMVIATNPADGSTIAKSPGSVSVTFNQPVDPFSYNFFDVRVEQLVGGQWVHTDTQGDAPVESLDATGTVFSVAVNNPLTPGTYRIVIDANSALLFLDGTSANSTGQDEVISQFTVATSGVTLADATDLGSPIVAPVSFAPILGQLPPSGGSSSVTSGFLATSGQLDLSNTPSDVQLFTFTLPSGHHWRLGTEVLALQNGSPLQTTLTLFDSQGSVIATSSHGRTTIGGDPYLFQGLDGGTYYIGVSGRGNVPGAPGGYNPVTGTLGVLPSAEPGGTYQLTIAADAADSPTQLLASSLEYADPIDPRPTGIALQFSGPLNVDTLRGTPSKGLELVDANGKTYSVTAIGMDESNATYHLAWDQMLPAGHYLLRERAPADGGLTDLAGASPVASGQPDGVLASFNVSDGGAVAVDPSNVGPIFSGAPQPLSRTTEIDPGTAATYRFVAMSDAFYQIQNFFSGSSINVSVIGSGFSSSYSQAQTRGLATPVVLLKKGVYFLQITNDGSTRETVSFELKQNTSADSLLMNGVGQGPALNLRLVNPTSASLTTAAPSSTYGPSPESPVYGPQSQNIGANAGSISSALSNATANPVPGTTTTNVSGLSTGGVYVAVGNTLIGRPTTESEHVAVVGPTGTTGAVALALNGQSLLPGINYGRGNSGGVAGEVPKDDGDASGPDGVSPVNGAIAGTFEKGEALTDQKVIASADFIGNLSANASRLLVSLAGLPVSSDTTDELDEALMLEDEGSSKKDERVEQAQLGSPLILGAATVMALQYYTPMRRWLEKNRARSLSRGNGYRGPHRRA